MFLYIKWKKYFCLFLCFSFCLIVIVFIVVRSALSYSNVCTSLSFQFIPLMDWISFRLWYTMASLSPVFTSWHLLLHTNGSKHLPSTKTPADVSATTTPSAQVSAMTNWPGQVSAIAPTSVQDSSSAKPLYRSFPPPISLTGLCYCHRFYPGFCPSHGLCPCLCHHHANLQVSTFGTTHPRSQSHVSIRVQGGLRKFFIS